MSTRRKRLFLFVIAALFIAILVIAGGVGYYIWSEQRVLPGRGEITLSGLDGAVEVYFDRYDIPHIEAKSEQDIARVIGYLQASYRLWQMDLTRRMATGRLAEVFGKSLLPVDTFQRVIGLHRFAKRAPSEMETETVALIQAYTDGINTLLKENKTYKTFRMSIKQTIKSGHLPIALARILAKYKANQDQSSESGYKQMQYMWKYASPFLPKMKKEYDVAISYLWPHDLVAKKVKAKTKVAWIHTDFSTVETDQKADVEIWDHFHHIIAVSDDS